ncbi:unnamed protein product [Ectocarpus sp. 4 AP-2014]
MRETVGFGVLAVFLLQASPASGFGGGPLVRPPSKTGGSPATSMRYSSRPRTFNRQEEHGRGGCLLVPGATADGAGEKQEPAKAKSAPKKAVGGLAGWDWGFKSTSKKPGATPAKAEPVAVMKAETGGDGVDAKAEKVALDAEAAEIAEVKRKAAAEIKAEQAVAAAEAAGVAEVEEVKRQAAAEILAEQEEEKARKKEIAERAAKAKRAEEMAAIARGDAPKKAAAKKPAKEDEKGEEKKAEPAKAQAAKTEPAKAKPAKAEPAKAESTKAKPAKAEAAKAEPAKAEPAKAKPARKSSAGTGGWDWGFKSTPRKTVAKPAAAAAVKAKPADEKAEAKKEANKAKAKALEEGRAAAAAAAAAEAEKIAEIEKKAAAEIEEKAAAAAKAKAEAKAEAGAARARHELRAQEMAAEARGDVPKPKKKAAPKKKSAGTDDKKKEGGDKKTKDGDKKRENAEKKTKKTMKTKKATSKKEETPKDDKRDDAAGGGNEAAADGAEKEGGETAEEATPAKTEKKASTGGGGGGWGRFGFAPPSKKASTSSITLTKPETIVVVTGATGRVGSLAVRRLLELYPNVLVRAVVTDMAKGKRLLKEEIDKYGIKLEIVSAELGGMRSAANVVAGASAVVFCASGFAQNLSPIERLANAVRLTINPSSVADVEGVRDVATALKATKKLVSKASKAQQENDDKAKGKAEEGVKAKEDEEPEPLYPNAPRFVLLSSAAVTRPNWSSEDKALYPLSADVPIVKLNPLNILTVKAEGERELREVGIPYVVVRPCGLNDDHPRGRPMFSVGDTAAGRICREDVADVLVRCLGTPEATGKTFEVQSLPGFEKVASSVKTNNKGNIDQALAGLPTDESMSKDPEMLKNFRRYTYPVLTQLRPVPLVQMSKNDE